MTQQMNSEFPKYSTFQKYKNFKLKLLSFIYLFVTEIPINYHGINVIVKFLISILLFISDQSWLINMIAPRALCNNKKFDTPKVKVCVCVFISFHHRGFS